MKKLITAIIVIIGSLITLSVNAGQCIPQSETHEPSGRQLYTVNYNSYVHKGIKRKAHPSQMLFEGRNPNHSGHPDAVNRFIPGNSFIKGLPRDEIISQRLEVYREDQYRRIGTKYSAKPGSGMTWIVEIGGCKYSEIVFYGASGGSPGITKEILAGIEGTIINE